MSMTKRRRKEYCYEPAPPNDVTRRILGRLLYVIKENGWRRSDDCIYEEITVDGWSTNAYRKRCTIAEYVYTLPSPVADPDGFALFAKGGSSALDEAYRMILRTRCEDMFPTLRPCALQWSFANGVYDAVQDRFWAYDAAETDEDPESPFVQGVYSACFISVPFDKERLMSPLVRFSPEHIEVHSFESIFRGQGFGSKHCEFLWTMLGRSLFPLNSREQWGILPVLASMTNNSGADVIIKAMRTLTNGPAPTLLCNAEIAPTCQHAASTLCVHFCKTIARDESTLLRAAIAELPAILVKANRFYQRNAMIIADPGEIFYAGQQEETKADDEDEDEYVDEDEDEDEDDGASTTLEWSSDTDEEQQGEQAVVCENNMTHASPTRRVKRSRPITHEQARALIEQLRRRQQQRRKAQG